MNNHKASQIVNTNPNLGFHEDHMRIASASSLSVINELCVGNEHFVTMNAKMQSKEALPKQQTCIISR